MDITELINVELVLREWVQHGAMEIVHGVMQNRRVYPRTTLVMVRNNTFFVIKAKEMNLILNM